MLTHRCLAATAAVVALASWLPWAASPGVAALRSRVLPRQLRGALRHDRQSVPTRCPIANAPIVGHGRDAATEMATGSSGPTAASSATATPASSAPTGALRLNAPDRRHGGQRPTAAAIGSWRRRRHLQLRRRRRSSGRPARSHLNAPIVGMAATARRQGLLVGGAPTGASSATATPASAGSAGGHASQCSRRRDGGDARRRRATGWWLRRRHLQLRRRPVRRLDRCARTSTRRSSAWRPRRTAAATGWWPRRRHLHLRRRAAYYGSLGGTALPRPVVGMAATPAGGGYWLVRRLRAPGRQGRRDRPGPQRPELQRTRRHRPARVQRHRRRALRHDGHGDRQWVHGGRSSTSTWPPTWRQTCRPRAPRSC